MEKKIFKNISALWVGMFVLLMVIFVIILYSTLRQWTFEELQGKIDLIEYGIQQNGMEYMKNLQMQDRLTWIDADGTVLYDNFTDASAMLGQKDYYEVQEALEYGQGQEVRFSELLTQNTLYYAQKIEDGTILRISCTKGILKMLFYPLIYPASVTLFIILVLSALFASKLSKQILNPINEIDFEDLDLNKNNSHIYPELKPFLQRIEQQNQTIQKQIQKMNQKKQEFSAITGNMSEGFILTDNQANVISYNASALKLLGTLPDEDGRCALNSNKIFREVASEALCGRRMEQLLELQGRCCQFIATPVIQNGQVGGTVIVILDVTEKEQRERLRRDFTANVSHELKTPLTSISGFAEIIREGFTEPEKTREFAGDIYNESQRLITLVNDIIRLSALDEGALEQEKEKVNLYQTARQVIEQLKSAAEKSSVEFILEGQDVFIDGVSQILEEVIFNLCDNAVKYNRPGGRVVIRIQPENETVSFSVEDTGIGIPKAAQNRVFERFYRVDKSHSRAMGGTGLGLSIVKHGAACHHAEIQLESVEGRGTAITVRFPLTRI